MCFIVSALNHGMHKIQTRQDLISRLKAAGYNDPQAAADYDGLNLEEFAVKIFPDMYNEVTSPCFEKVEDLGNGVEGETPIKKMTYKGKTTYSLSSSIKISKIAFSSYLRLSSAMGHELVHVENVINGNMSFWFNKYGGENYREAMSELSSINWEIQNGGLPNYNLFRHYNNVMSGFKN